jgi:hypothetical protein
VEDLAATVVEQPTPPIERIHVATVTFNAATFAWLTVGVIRNRGGRERLTIALGLLVGVFGWHGRRAS